MNMVPSEGMDAADPNLERTSAKACTGVASIVCGSFSRQVQAADAAGSGADFMVAAQGRVTNVATGAACSKAAS